MDSAAARIILDVSTSVRFRFSPANKYTRIEQALVDELNVTQDAVVAVRDSATFVRVARPEPHAAGYRRTEVGQLIDACARHFDTSQRGRCESWKPFGHLFATEPSFAFEGGDLMILAGASWYHLDLAGLRKLKEKAGFKLVGLVYDLLPIHYPSLITVEGRKAYRNFLLDLAEVADLIATPSAAVRDELRDFFVMQGLRAPAQIVSVSLASAALPSGQGTASWRLLKHRLHKRRFALCVAPLRKRKHFLWLYSLWMELWKTERNPPILVCAGAFREPDLLSFLRRDPLWGRAGIFIRDPSDAELHWLYSQSLLCLHPSFEGGLGLPVREALSHSKICIAADAPSLVEAGGGRSIHLPQDRGVWLAMIRKFIATAPGESIGRNAEYAIPHRPILEQILEQLAVPAGCDQ